MYARERKITRRGMKMRLARDKTTHLRHEQKVCRGQKKGAGPKSRDGDFRAAQSGKTLKIDARNSEQTISKAGKSHKFRR